MIEAPCYCDLPSYMAVVTVSSRGNVITKNLDCQSLSEPILLQADISFSSRGTLILS